ncbi:MAG TPA: hypothetical protein VG273_02185 [Bryobacteraceae bacterium]|nr:hypothetical protein [Bryobacteraceae bacterium]
MKKTVLATLIVSFGALSAQAADFWLSKPPAEWSDKDVQKIMTNSPWAKPFSVPVPSGASRSAAGGRGGGRGGGSIDVEKPGMIPANATDGAGGGRGGPRGGGGGEAAPAVASVDVVARWQSALPLKQALMRVKFGAEAGTSAQAKQFLDQVETSYVLILSGLRGPLMRANPETLKAALMSETFLAVKGKEGLKPADAQISADAKSWEIVLFFPRSNPYTLEDKEVELSTKLANQPLKYKFRLKDMVINGKLEL